jgi:hypothetical protein
MIVVKLAGGLGNQMFQYAAGRFLAEKHNTQLKLDTSFLLDRKPRKNFIYRDYDLDIFNIQVSFASANEILSFGKFRTLGRLTYVVKQRLFNKQYPVYVRENPYRFDPKFFHIPSNAYIEGYWQSECYFKPITNIIRRDFSFYKPLDRLGREMAQQVSMVNSVCLNVRRGDYVSIKATNKHHGVCEKDYFHRGISFIADKIEKPHYFIFSDDVEWCRDNLVFDYPHTIVENKYAGFKFGQKLQLMTMCKHFIIANSSFAWWAAWLCSHSEKIVIAPLNWYRNPRMNTQYLIPNSWVRI